MTTTAKRLRGYVPYRPAFTVVKSAISLKYHGWRPAETFIRGYAATRLENSEMWQRCMPGCSCLVHAMVTQIVGARRCMLHTRLVAIQLYMQPNNQTLSQQREPFSSIVPSHTSIIHI